MQIKSFYKWVFAICMLTLHIACTNRKTDFKSPSPYDFNRPVILKLPREMNEISGIAYYPKDTSIFAQCDGLGYIYKLKINNLKQVDKWKFGKGKDYEDILLIDSNFYLLKSDGKILQMKFASNGKLYGQEYPFPDSTGNEFEAMYYHKGSGNIIVICKKCKGSPQFAIPSFAFNPKTGTFQPWHNIDLKGIEKSLTDEEKIEVRPSAACLHPRTGDLYILTSIDKLLVITDSVGRFKSAYKLNARIFKQPEGISFSSGGDLFISNESADVGVANLLFFQYKSISRK